MAEIPRDMAFDNSLALLREGYRFVGRRCDRLGSDVFRTRIMLKDVVCMRGAEATKLFYGGDVFTREGAMPPTTLRLLQDKGSVQLLEGEHHRRRKRLFISVLMSDPQLDRLRALFAEHWLQALQAWEHRSEIILFDEVNLVLTRAGCAWAGVPLDQKTASEMTRELSSMVENAGRFGPRNWHALWLRNRTERYVRGLIKRVRTGDLALADESPLAVVARHADFDREPLAINTAAVEMINLLRPIAAIGRFIMFAAMALNDHPEWRSRFAAGNERHLEGFVEEVRRFYPFFPAIGGRVREPFEWKGIRFERGSWCSLTFTAPTIIRAFLPSRSDFYLTEDFRGETKATTSSPKAEAIRTWHIVALAKARLSN
jgi:fatty-acid peroxygenase